MQAAFLLLPDGLRQQMAAKGLVNDDARKVLRVSTCDLSHLRQGGKIAFRKAGNAYLYSARDCEQFVRRPDDKKAH